MRAVAKIGSAPLRAVLYLRQSSFREESISLELQENAAREHATRMGYVIVATESDPGISGRTWNRPAVQRVMRMIERGEADRVILWKWSRLSRERYDWAAARKLVETAGGRIESATEPNDVETPEGRLMLDQMISFAVYESERMGSVWKETHARRRRLGLPHSGVARFGYSKLDDGSYVVDPETGPILEEMYERYVAGEGASRIARWLNDTGRTTLGGNSWGRVSLTGMLDSGFGAGLLIQGAGKGRRSPRSATYIDGAHDGVISAEMWGDYSRRRQAAPLPSRVSEPSYMLAGLVRCSDCGGTMHVATDSKSSNYVCARARDNAGIRRIAMKRVLVETVVTEWVKTFANDVDAMAAAKAKLASGRIKAISDKSAIDARIQKIDRQMAQLTVRWVDGKIPDSAYEATVADLDTKRDTLNKRVATPSVDDGSREINVREIAISLAQQWEKFTVFEKHSALRRLVKRVDIVPAVRQGQGAWRERVTVIPAWED